MKNKLYKISLILVALGFTIFFIVVVSPPFLKDPDLIDALSAGFVNPYSSGYALDALTCWGILAIWVIYESSIVKYGWICLILGLVPGVVVGFAAYLILRMKYVKTVPINK